MRVLDRVQPWLLATVVVGGCGEPPVQAAREPVVLTDAAPFTVPPRSAWPTQSWPRATPAEQGIDEAALARLTDYLFARHGDDADRKGQRTNAFVLVRGGKLVYERYARGYSADTPMLTWSVSKSVLNTLLGAAVQRGQLQLNQPAAHYYPAMARPGVEAILVDDLLRMSSGLAWNEAYEASPVFSSVMAMLYTRGANDMAAFVASHGLAAAPGTRWSYSSGDSMVLSAVLRGAVGEDAYAEFPWTAVFTPLGMQSARFERDPAGNYVGSSYFYASAQDLARWALLYLHDGVWDGQQILAPGWVAYTLSMAPAYYTSEVGPELWEENPGAQVYLNRGDPTRNIPKPWPSAPDDTFAALGHWGKSVYVIPSLDMIAVRLGDDREQGCSPVAARPGCVADKTRAFTKDYYLELLTGLVQP